MVLDALREEIKNTVRIEELVAEFTELQLEGGKMKGVCPFPHAGSPDEPIYEDKGSFMVNPAKGDFFCFGCEKGNSQKADVFGQKNYGSDVIAFWREMRRQQTGREEGFRETLTSLAHHVGLAHLVPTEEVDDEKQRILQIQSERARDWNGALTRHPEVRRYLNDRGVTDPIIEQFMLGYARGYQVPEYIRNRVSIPIRHAFTGQTLAFSYRTLRDDDDPKYMHSATSPVWKASENLFGLYEASRSISKERYAIVTEDFFGPLVMASAGITNVVGALGVSIKESQARLLRRYTDTLFWWIEDDSGYRGFLGMAPMLFGMGFRVYVIEAGMDADEFCLANDHNTDAIKTGIANQARYAPPWLAQQQHKRVQEGMAEDRALNALAPILGSFVQHADRAICGREIQHLFGVDPNLLVR